MGLQVRLVTRGFAVCAPEVMSLIEEDGLIAMRDKVDLNSRSDQPKGREKKKERKTEEVRRKRCD